MVLYVQKRLGTEGAEVSTQAWCVGKEISLEQWKGYRGAGAELVWGASGRENLGSGEQLPLLSHETGALRASKHSSGKLIRFSSTESSFCSPLGFVCFCRNTYCIEEAKATRLEAQLFIPPLPCSLPAGRVACNTCGQIKPFPSP